MREAVSWQEVAFTVLDLDCLEENFKKGEIFGWKKWK
jgi:hypothetical protein